MSDRPAAVDPPAPPNPKPTFEQIAWVFECLLANHAQRGTYRNLIYGLMGFGKEAYRPLLRGMEVNNLFPDDVPPPRTQGS
jgi:hypothetical protein